MENPQDIPTWDSTEYDATMRRIKIYTYIVGAISIIGTIIGLSSTFLR